jgi:hypothetical protein
MFLIGQSSQFVRDSIYRKEMIHVVEIGQSVC